MTSRCLPIVCAWAMICMGGITYAQSSSLFLTELESPALPQRGNGGVNKLSPHIAAVSLTAARMPEPRQFAVQDLITIIVRESIENDSQSSLETQKEYKKDGKITAMPKLRLQDLVEFQLNQSDLSKGAPQVGIDVKTDFSGDGSFKRKETFTARITARIIDIKPNGTMVLEARKFIQTDDESLNMVLTGTCRADDITADNTVLSTQLYDLRLIKEHTGELRNSNKKGFFTQLFDFIFNF